MNYMCKIKIQIKYSIATSGQFCQDRDKIQPSIIYNAIERVNKYRHMQ